MGTADAVVDDLRDFLERTDPGGVVGTYLYGSSVLGGLRPDSDIDVLVLTRRALTHSDRRVLTDFLLQFSGRRATVAPGRPLEVTTLVVDDVVPWRYPPTCDYLYGEWLRDQYLGDDLPMVVTVRTGRIVAKDEAARLLLPGLDEPHRRLLDRAGRAYGGDVHDDWDDHRDATAATAAHLAGLVRGPRGGR